MAFNGHLSGHRNSYHYVRANEFWTLRMKEGESFALFKNKIQRWERMLHYSFDHLSEQQKIDMWIGRLPPMLLERVRARTSDLFNLTSLDDLLTTLSRMESTDWRIEHAVDFYKVPAEVDLSSPTVMWMFENEVKEILDAHDGFFKNAPEYNQATLDKFLSFFPPNLREMFRLRTFNFRNVSSFDEAVAKLKHQVELDLCFDTTERWQSFNARVCAKERDNLAKAYERPREFIKELEAESSERAQEEIRLEKLKAQQTEYKLEPPIGNSSIANLNSTHRRNAARRNRRRERRQRGVYHPNQHQPSLKNQQWRPATRISPQNTISWPMNTGTCVSKKVRASSYSSTKSERRLHYDFSRLSERRKLDLWLGRLPPTLRERVQVRTNDLCDLQTVEDLFGVLERMEKADERMEAAAKIFDSPPSEITDDFPHPDDWYYKTFQRIPESEPWYFEENQDPQQALDMLLARLPGDLHRILRVRTDNFEKILDWEDLLIHVQPIVDMNVTYGCGCCTEPEDGPSEEELASLRRDIDESDIRAEYHFRKSKRFCSHHVGHKEKPLGLSFRTRAQALETLLDYDLSKMPEERKIEMWLGRLTPELTERVQVRTNDFADLKTVKDLFDIIERIEAADVRVARGRLMFETPASLASISDLEYINSTSAFLARLTRFIGVQDLDVLGPEHKQHEIDMLLARIPPQVFVELRRDTDNFREVSTLVQIYHKLDEMARRGGPAELATDKALKYSAEDTSGRMLVRVRVAEKIDEGEGETERHEPTKLSWGTALQKEQQITLSPATSTSAESNTNGNRRRSGAARRRRRNQNRRNPY
ncbi:hypothetical protein IWZ01DRAFT_546003 [Phyllosticta capitalensis]